MKPEYFILFFLLLGLNACKKEFSPIVGKWQEVKLHTYNQDKTTGAISDDTTYQAATFGNFDYVQFSNNGTCTLSSAALSISGGSARTIQQLQSFTYARAGSGYTLTKVSQNSAVINEVVTTDTVLNPSSNTVIIHAVSNYENPTVTYKSVYDAYYTK